MQMKFFSVKSKNDWNSRDLWKHLKKRYSSTRWSFKWAAFNNLKMLIYESSIIDLKSKILNVLAELKSQNLIIEQIVIFKVLNILKSSFFIYLIVLMKSARKENKFSILISLFQNLANEENRQRAERMINFIKKEAEINRNNQSKKDNKRKNKKNDETTRMTTKSASNAIVSIIQKMNVRRSTQNASNVTKSIIENKCVESKRETINSIRDHLVKTTKSRMNHLSLKRLH